jgi:hypothetical protein
MAGQREQQKATIPSWKRALDEKKAQRNKNNPKAKAAPSKSAPPAVKKAPLKPTTEIYIDVEGNKHGPLPDRPSKNAHTKDLSEKVMHKFWAKDEYLEIMPLPTAPRATSSVKMPDPNEERSPSATPLLPANAFELRQKYIADFFHSPSAVRKPSFQVLIKTTKNPYKMCEEFAEETKNQSHDEKFIFRVSAIQGTMVEVARLTNIDARTLNYDDYMKDMKNHHGINYPMVAKTQTYWEGKNMIHSTTLFTEAKMKPKAVQDCQRIFHPAKKTGHPCNIPALAVIRHPKGVPVTQETLAYEEKCFEMDMDTQTSLTYIELKGKTKDIRICQSYFIVVVSLSRT